MSTPQANPAKKTIGFMLHGVGPVPRHIEADEIPYWTGIARFNAILDIAQSAPNRVLVTFDDGNRTDLDIALPALQARGLHAWFFVLSSRIGKPGYLDAEAIRALRAGGMTIGIHGSRHIPWKGLDETTWLADFEPCRQRLEDILGEAVDSVALPFGEVDFGVCRLLRRAGMARVFTSFHGPTLDSDWLVRRECVKETVDLATIEQWLTRPYGVGDFAYSFLRAARHVRHAALWRA